MSHLVVSERVEVSHRTSLLSFSIIRNVKQAIEILTDKDGIGMPKSKITVSTSGVAPGLAKLAELGGISLAISLHATNDNLRDEIVPINKYVGWIAACTESALDWHERKECACTDHIHFLVITVEHSLSRSSWKHARIMLKRWRAAVATVSESPLSM